MTIYRFDPIYQNYIWGGERIAPLYNKRGSRLSIAESWEISDRPDAMSRTQTGQTLADLRKELGLNHTFPLLIKLIDARESLSVQVHPNEESAQELKGEPKSEMWIALETSEVYAGVKKGVTLDELNRALLSGTVVSLLERYTLQRGEALYIPGGVIHSIGAGSLLFEVQQNSNTTYRLFDWGRGRSLHLKEGLQALRYLAQPIFSSDPSKIINPYFFARWEVVRGSLKFDETPEYVFCADGAGWVNGEECRKGDSLLITPSTRGLLLQGDLDLIVLSLLN